MASGTTSERPSVLDNPHAERVRRVAALAGRSARSRADQILVEGPQAVRELVVHRGGDIVDVYLTEAAAHRYPEIEQSARQATRWLHLVSEDVAHAMSGEAQGVVAVARFSAIRGAMPRAPRLGGATMVVLAQAQDPGNAGTIIRTSDAMGAVGVVVAKGSVDIRSPKVIRSSAGSVFHLPVISGIDLEQASVDLRDQGWLLLGTSGAHAAEDLAHLLVAGLEAGRRAVLDTPHAWVMGNEARGLSASQEALCDRMVAVPMTGAAESLNVSSAVAMCLFASQTVRTVRASR